MISHGRRFGFSWFAALAIFALAAQGCGDSGPGPDRSDAGGTGGNRTDGGAGTGPADGHAGSGGSGGSGGHAGSGGMGVAGSDGGAGSSGAAGSGGAGGAGGTGGSPQTCTSGLACTLANDANGICMSNACATCATDSQCLTAYGASHICVSGACISGTCHDGSECTSAQICSLGTHTCGACTDDNSCQTSHGAGHLCQNGQCISGNCRIAATDCSNGQICVNNNCTACTSSSQCAVGQLCISGGCITGQCQVSADCTGGKICNASYACVSCTADAQCGANHLCQGGSCVTGNCRTSSDCAASGLICDIPNLTCSACTSDPACAQAYDASHICVSGVCVVGNCHTTATCGGQLCNNFTCGACPDDPACVSGYGAGYICKNATCVTGCRLAQDCGGGKLCDASNACVACGGANGNAQCVSGYGANHVCVGGVCMSGNCQTTADCGGGQVCNTTSHTCVACSGDAQCVSEFGPMQLCLSGACTAGDCRASSDCTGGKLCNTTSHFCAGCGSDAACKGDSTYGSTTICLASACTIGDCHDTSIDCPSGQICGISSPHTCGACASDGQCTADARYGAGNICYLGACQAGNCHANSADCTGGNQGRICGASTPNNCGSCATDGQCKADAFYGSSTICTTTAGATQGTCVSAACATNSTACTANTSDFCCGNQCVPGNCCNDTDCVNNPSFGVGYACVSNSCSQCAPASGNKYYVDPVGGNDQTATGSGLSGATATPSCRFKTIARAIQVIGNFAAPNTKVFIVGVAGQTTGLSAGDVLPITLPPNVIISTQGGPVTISLAAAANQANPNSNSGFILSTNGSGISGDPTAPLTLEGNGTSGRAVAVTTAGVVTSLSNVTIQNTRDRAILVSAGTLNIGAGVVEKTAGSIAPAIARNGLEITGGVVNINVPVNQSPTSFNSNTSHGIQVSGLGSVNIVGVPGAPVPSNNGTVVTAFNSGAAGLRIDQTAGATAVNDINGLVSWGNGQYGARLRTPGKINLRNCVFLGNGNDGVLVDPTAATVAANSLAGFDFGTAGSPGHNYFQVPLGALGNQPTAGLCVSMTANLATTLTLNALGNFMVSGSSQVDCSTSTATITRGTCANRNSLGMPATGTTIVNVDVSTCM